MQELILSVVHYIILKGILYPGSRLIYLVLVGIQQLQQVQTERIQCY